MQRPVTNHSEGARKAGPPSDEQCPRRAQERGPGLTPGPRFPHSRQIRAGMPPIHS